MTLVSCSRPTGGGVASVGSAGPASGPRLSAEQARLAWARCMRAHGVNQPDPGQGSGQPPEITNKAAYNAARQACEPILRDAGLSTTRTPSAAQLDQMVRYARCMRDHGQPVSDPHMENGEMVVDVPKNFNSPQYRQADQACKHFLGNKSGGGSGGPKA